MPTSNDDENIMKALDGLFARSKYSQNTFFPYLRILQEAFEITKRGNLEIHTDEFRDVFVQSVNKMLKESNLEPDFMNGFEKTPTRAIIDFLEQFPTPFVGNESFGFPLLAYLKIFDKKES